MNKSKQAVILCAGKGERMGPAFRDRQKCTLIINEKPLILQNVENLIQAGIKQIILLTGHKQEQIRQALANLNGQASIEYIFCGDPYQAPLNTISTLAQAKPLIQEPFLCIHGDIIVKRQAIKQLMQAFYRYNPAMLIMVSKQIALAGTHTRVEYDGNLRVTSVKLPSDAPEADVWIGADIYQPDILSHYCQNPSIKSQKDLAEAVLSAKGVIKVKQYDKNWFHLVKPDDLIRA